MPTARPLLWTWPKPCLWGLRRLSEPASALSKRDLEAALDERPRPGGPRTLAGKQEALLAALAWSTPPDERQCWTRQLLADKLVELKQVESMADETVRRPLQKTASNHG